MITIATKNDSYAIYENEKLIILCENPISTFNEVIKNIGVDLTNVEIIEVDNIKKVLFDVELITNNSDVVTTSDFNSIIDANDNFNNRMNDITDEVIQEMNNFMFNNPEVTEEYIIPSDDTVEDYDYNDSTSYIASEPVGNVEMPNLGDLVYIEGVRGTLRVITGGVGTVNVIKDDMIELEEIPGQYFSWNDLREKQEKLKNTYGYKPASMI